MKKLFTSESVTEGHPDKLCDQIADAILDSYMKVDPYARVACEVVVKDKLVYIMGEITSNKEINLEKIVRKTIIDIGYDKDDYGFNGHNCEININLSKQSENIKLLVDKDGDIGAGDQGIMFGYACNETEELMPLPIVLAHKLAKQLAYVRKNNIIKNLRPDGKTQVTIEYEFDLPIRVDNIVISTQHDNNINLEELRSNIKKYIIDIIIPKHLLIDTKIHINEAGQFVIGGPVADSGLTGRKIIVDTYGGYARHGGGSFSGKDATKVDRSGAYIARHIAKNIVASKIADKCEIQLSYAIGLTKPLSIMVDTFNTSKYKDEEIINIINNIWDLSPSSIINMLDLRKPIYRQLASYGHIGRTDLDINFEKTNKVDEIIKYLK
ncbi:MAG: methionine adenosyltransferase [Bacilli bacterium]|nr:methionine adenosyltransferase [Bacilli bacterium]